MRLKIILMAVVVMVFVAGCGSGGNSSSSKSTATKGDSNASTGQKESSSANADSKPMTKTAFRTRINEICIQVPPGYKELLKKLRVGGKKPSKAESNLKAAVPPLRSAVEEMNAVVPPPSEEKNLEKVIAALESAANGLEAEPTSELSGPESPFAEFQAVTKRYGFETCSGL
jgi:hypothetical protein